MTVITMRRKELTGLQILIGLRIAARVLSGLSVLTARFLPRDLIRALVFERAKSATSPSRSGLTPGQLARYRFVNRSK
jgi:hypothetical protein